jgi:succinate-semialdehyde dehydrogenase / glutarate-semialdehyde dehydrogenase
MEYTDLYINGTWHKTDTRFDVINPATEQVLASVASADIADADAALDAAEVAMADWAARSPRQRAEVLRRAWELMTARLDHFAHSDHAGKRQGPGDAMGEATMPPNSSAGSPKRPCARTG